MIETEFCKVEAPFCEGGAKKLGMEWILQFVERIFLRWSELARLWSEKTENGAKLMFCGVKFPKEERILKDLG